MFIKYKTKWLYSTKRFDLTGLPIVVLRGVVRSLSVQDRINLALSSNRLSYFLVLTRVPVSCYYICIKDDHSYIQMELEEDKSVFFFIDDRDCNDGFNRINLERWLKKTDGYSVDNLSKVFKNVKEMFPSSNLIMNFHLDKMKIANIKDILSIPVFRKWKFLRISGEKIDYTDLEFIFDMADSDRQISIQLEQFPVNFRHEKAFNFWDIEYDVADWVQIEDLFSLRNSSIVTLCHNEFNCSELNRLICFWKNCNYSMFRQLTIHMKPEIIFATNMVFDKIVYWETFRHGHQEFILLSQHCEDVERPLIVISWMGSSFQMRAVGHEEYPEEFETLKMIVSSEQYKHTNRR